MKLLWAQPTYAGMVKESFSNRVTIKTSINGNQPCIYMKGKLQEGSKCRVPKAEMSLVHLRIRKNISLIAWFEWEIGKRRTESGWESDHMELYRPKMEYGFFFFFNSWFSHWWIVQRIGMIIMLLKFTLRGIKWRISLGSEKDERRGSCLGLEKYNGSLSWTGRG